MPKKYPIKEKELPFHNVKIETQIEILKEFANLTAEGKSKVTREDVAPRVGIHAHNISPCLKFWISIGLLDKENKGYKASDKTLEFSRKIEWGDNEKAWLIIRTHLANTWFGEQIIKAFKDEKPLNENELANILGSVSGRVQRDKSLVRSLKAILKLLELSKMIIKDKAGNYTLNTEVSVKPERKPIKIPEDKDMITVYIGEETFVVDIKELIEFVKTRGKTLAKEEVKLE